MNAAITELKRLVIRLMTDELLLKIQNNRNLCRDRAFCELLAASLHTHYIEGPSYEKDILNIIGKSKVDNSITLMPKQLEMLHFVKNNHNVVLSAPTSFGKSFLIFEFIKSLSVQPHLVLYVVHTRALSTEVTNNFKKYFGAQYNVVNDFDSLLEDRSNVLVTISDGQNIYESFIQKLSIDILIIDEAYNLDPDQSSENRFLTVYQNCLEYMKKSKKILLIGPFIKEVNDLTKENFDFKLFKTNYSPVTEMLVEGSDLEDNNPSKIFVDCIRRGENTIGFINSKDKIYKELDNLNSNFDLPNIFTDPFIEWMEDYFPDFWVLPKLMKKGIAVYHSSFPKYLNLYCMDLFNKRELKGLLTTSAILEGVNTSARNIVVYNSESGRRSGAKLTPFQFFNLCGRAGRLNQEIVGTIYNFGDTFAQYYNQRSLPLNIGASPDTAEYKFNLGYDSDETRPIKERIINLLRGIGIEYDDWYDKYKFYFKNNCEKLIELINIYNAFKISFKNAIHDGTLKKKGSQELNKNTLVEYIYDSFIKLTDFRCKTVYKLSAPLVITDLLASKTGGVAFKMKEICGQRRISRIISGAENDYERNMIVVAIMKIAYDYIQYSYNYINVLLKDFISHDPYFNEEEKTSLNNYYFVRISTYLKLAENDRVAKVLLDCGFIPPLVKKITDYILRQGIEVKNKTNRELLVIIKSIIEENKIRLEPYEAINLSTIKL